MMYKHKPQLFCCDANMCLLDLQDSIEELHKTIGKRTYTRPVPKITTAAWFPFHMHKLKGSCGLGIDSVGIFYISYERDSSVQEARHASVEPFVGINRLDRLFAAPGDKAWNDKYEEGQGNNKTSHLFSNF